MLKQRMGTNLEGVEEIALVDLLFPAVQCLQNFPEPKVTEVIEFSSSTAACLSKDLLQFLVPSI